MRSWAVAGTMPRHRLLPHLAHLQLDVAAPRVYRA